MKFSDMWISYDHAAKNWRVSHEGEGEQMTFLGTAKTYTAARQLAKRKAGL